MSSRISLLRRRLLNPKKAVQLDQGQVLLPPLQQPLLKGTPPLIKKKPKKSES